MDSEKKKRDIKDTEKVEEEKKETTTEQNDANKGDKQSKSKKKKEHVKTEICAKPPTEEEINQRFEGSYLQEMNFGSFKPLIEVEGRIPCPK